MANRRKVLLLNVTWGYGSTGAIASAIFDACAASSDFEPVAIYGRDYDNAAEKNVHLAASAFYGKLQHFLANVSGIPYGGCFFSTNRIIRLIKKEKPDLIHIHCINGHFVNIYRLLRFIGKSGVPLVVTNHAAFYYTGYCIYPLECKKWKSGSDGCHNCPHLDLGGSYFFDRTSTCAKRMGTAFASIKNLTVTSVSPFTKSQSEESTVLKQARNLCIPNGVDTSKFSYLKSKKDRTKYSLLCILPSLTSQIKGGNLLPMLVSEIKRDCIIRIIGLPQDACFSDPRVENIGKVNREDLAQYYSAADAVILLSKAETFSMIVAEAACCGTKTFGFESGGPESVFGSEYATFVPYGNYKALAALIDNDVPDGQQEKFARAKKAADDFNQLTMAKSYLALYRDILGLENEKGERLS